MVKLNQDCIAPNVPSTDTYISKDHGIVIDEKIVRAKELINGNTINKEYLPDQFLYNVCLETHGTMMVNNLKVETLDPKAFNSSITKK